VKALGYAHAEFLVGFEQFARPMTSSEGEVALAVDFEGAFLDFGGGGGEDEGDEEGEKEEEAGMHHGGKVVV